MENRVGSFFLRAFRVSRVIVLGGLALLISACGSDHKAIPEIPTTPAKPTIAGYLYTTTNGEGDNFVVRFDRMSDGSIGTEKLFNTMDSGGANPAAGGDAHGDFDAQGAIQIIGDYLLAVNAGGHTISTFKINKENGDLTFEEIIDSGGMRPVSITYTLKKGSTTDYWVVVANQWNNPNIQHGDGSDKAIERYPNNAFFSGDLTAADASDKFRNIVLFSFDSTNGDLERVNAERLDSYSRQNGGPTTAIFSEDGSKLAVSTWGIAHFATSTPSLTEQRPSRVYVYDFDKVTGKVSNRRHYEKNGLAGTIGINWAKGSNSVIHASNFNPTADLLDYGLTVLTDNGNTVIKTQNFATGAATNRDEACWTVLSPDGRRLYVTSFNANVITPFEVAENGTVSKALPFVARGGDAPAGDSKDSYVTVDHKYLYNIGAFQSYSLNTFDITADGLKYKSQYKVKATAAAEGSAGSYNFLGLTGFDKK
ncbi:MAG: hypothetical protein ACPGUD_02245 [Parashewanella sp.]